jgi:hypothetical protein
VEPSGSRRDRRRAMQQDPVRRSLAHDTAARNCRLPQIPDPQGRLPFDADDAADTSQRADPTIPRIDEHE